MDPYAVLGVAPGASEEQVMRAYREAAKRHHPDIAAGDDARMRAINAAYAELRRIARRTRATAGGTGVPLHRRPRAGSWLQPRVQAMVGAELMGVLDLYEPVLLVTDAATWDSPVVRLVVTDRRLMWLRDDAIVDRVRYVRFRAVERVEARPPRPLRRSGELRVHRHGARRLIFAGLRPEVLTTIVGTVRPRLRPSRV
jgi:hypothetical protein